MSDISKIKLPNGNIYDLKDSNALHNDDVYVQDVQINNTTIVSNGIANIPYASGSDYGVISTSNLLGTAVSNVGKLYIYKSESNDIKTGTMQYRPIVPYNQHEAAFYGLAKAAGVDIASSNNAVGTYTIEAKSAIQAMLGVGTVDETIASTTPTINAVANHRYKCGEVSLLNFTPCTYGICEVIFTSGSTPTVLTLPNTVKMPLWFDIDVNRIYDIIITDGVYGAVTSWAV